MSENDNHLIDWLLEGDVSIQYQVHRYIFETIKPELRDRIAKEGGEQCSFLVAMRMVTGEGVFTPGFGIC